MHGAQPAMAMRGLNRLLLQRSLLQWPPQCWGGCAHRLVLKGSPKSQDVNCFCCSRCCYLQIAKSPLSANVAVEYIVTAGGVQQAPSMEGQAAVAVAPHSALNIPIVNAPPG